ncbi:hypothetical protein ACET3Z_008554 [Daucus carota]
MHNSWSAMMTPAASALTSNKDRFSKEFVSFLGFCFADFKKRPTPMQALDHPFRNDTITEDEMITCLVDDGLRNNGEVLFPKPDRHNKHIQPYDTGIVSWSPQTKYCKEFVKELDYNVTTFSREYDGIVYYNSRQLQHARPFIETLVLLGDADAVETSTQNYELTEFGNAIE